MTYRTKALLPLIALVALGAACTPQQARLVHDMIECRKTYEHCEIATGDKPAGVYGWSILDTAVLRCTEDMACWDGRTTDR